MTSSDDTPPLQSLDPGPVDPGYWERFQARVMEEAAPALDRRLRGAHPTVPQLVLSWGRFVVPSAVAAATVAWMLVSQSPLPTEVVSAAPEAGAWFLFADPPSEAFPTDPVALDSLDQGRVLFPVEGL